MPFVFRSFLPNDAPEASIVVHKNEPSAPLLLSLRGMIADLKAHAEVNGIKTTGGTKCCVTCDNVVQFIDTTGHATFEDMAERDTRKIILNSDADLYDKPDDPDGEDLCICRWHLAPGFLATIDLDTGEEHTLEEEQVLRLAGRHNAY